MGDDLEETSQEKPVIDWYIARDGQQFVPLSPKCKNSTNWDTYARTIWCGAKGFWTGGQLVRFSTTSRGCDQAVTAPGPNFAADAR